MNDSILISQPDTARLLGISIETVRRLVGRGVLTPVRLTPTSHPRFRRDEVEALAAGERVDVQAAGRAP
ncbi:MAG: helix-turn-helix domain-containing protein [Gaiellaceae bacterium]